MKTIDEIRAELAAAAPDIFETLCKKYEDDSRRGVQKLLIQYRKQREALEKEIKRTEQMKKFERQYEEQGYLCGIDEVGRGPWRGPS